MWTEWLTALILLLALIVEGYAGWLIYQTSADLRQLEAAITRAQAYASEQKLRLTELTRLRNNQQLAEDAIDTGTSLTREIHRGIASIPFSILENIPPTAGTARTVRKIHDSISGDIYAALSNLNRDVGRQLRGVAERDAGEQNPAGKKNTPSDKD